MTEHSSARQPDAAAYTNINNQKQYMNSTHTGLDTENKETDIHCASLKIMPKKCYFSTSLHILYEISDD